MTEDCAGRMILEKQSQAHLASTVNPAFTRKDRQPASLKTKTDVAQREQRGNSNKKTGAVNSCSIGQYVQRHRPADTPEEKVR